MIWSIFRKDWTLLWPLAVLVTIIQIAFEWAVYKFGFFGATPLARELLRLLTPAWFVGIIALVIAVVHEDTVPGVDQDWLIRPLARTDLLMAKMLFLLTTICLPMVVFNLIDELALRTTKWTARTCGILTSFCRSTKRVNTFSAGWFRRLPVPLHRRRAMHHPRRRLDAL